MKDRRRLLAHVVSHRGKVRSENEDTAGIAARRWGGDGDSEVEALEIDLPVLCVVADGMGGHAFGGLASRLVVDRLLERTEALDRGAPVASVLEEINESLYATMQDSPGRMGMGSTLAAVFAGRDDVTFFNVGDTRIYDLVPELRQLSVDHASYARAIGGRRTKLGLTRSLGGTPFRTRIQPAMGRLPSTAGTRIMLCSDGLTDMVDDRTLASLTHLPDDRFVRELLDRALDSGGDDNVTIMHLRVL